MNREHDLIVLTNDIAEVGLKAGDVGTVVHLYPDGKAAEIEFATEAGEAVAVVTLLAEQFRLAREDEIAHPRQ